MYVPHAVDVDGQIITMFDPVNHRRAEATEETVSVIANATLDQRWERIRRPVVVVGGELTLEMLDLSFNPISKFYEAPIQMKANGGVFVVDDFGRQRIPPRDLLNRWIVPLESRVDYMTLHTGRKFEIPFNVFIIFATNLKPESLADEAFLRRIPYKILAKNPTVDEYCRIFELNCTKRGLAVRSGDGGVPGAQLLPPAQAPDAGLPSARPRRAGGRHLPVSEEGAGDLARAARHGLQQLLPGRDRVARSRRMRALAIALNLPLNGRSLDWSAQARLFGDLAARAAIIVLFSMMAFRFGADFLETGRVTGLFLLASETLVVVLTLVRRSAAAIDRSIRARRPDARLDHGAAAARAGCGCRSGAGAHHGHDLDRRSRRS